MAKSPSQKMRDYRNRLRQAGLRPIQLWVPDVKAPGFGDRARAQSLQVSGSAGEDEAIGFLETLSDDVFSSS